MFDNYSFSLFNDLPTLPNFNIEETRRLLSKAYIYSIRMKLGLVQEEFLTIDLEALNEEELDKIEEDVGEDSLILFNELYHELRRLGDTLESSAVFDNIVNEKIIKSSSFVAAEALSLLATLLTREEEIKELEEVLFSNEVIFTRVEAAMLFLISGYDANAQTEINEVLKTLENMQYRDQEDNLFKIEYWCLHNFIALFTNKLWSISRDKPDLIVWEKSKSLKNLIKENKFQMYSLLGDSIISYIDWLIGEDNEGLTKSLEILTRINNSSFKNKYALYPEVYHLSKVLMTMINETSKRSLFHDLPLPVNEEADFIKYLRGRVKGNYLINSRPFIWESSKEFISECLPGPSKHTIVNLPTGSGKSFIAELAVAQSLSIGWTLYLAPTNALVHQIKRDLKNSLQFFDDVEIRSFVGGDEYTTLENEFLDGYDKTNKFVAVMTPEKCAMSLRLNPEIFRECSLCVFDECHLLGEGTRGATVDLVFGQILSISSTVKFVLMSAMLNNPNDLSDWLSKVTTFDSEICSISWKPTRSIRGAVGVEYHSYIETKEEAKNILSQMPEKRKREKFEPRLSILYSLTGIWNNNHNDYSLMQTKSKAKYVFSREKINRRWIHTDSAISWVNATSRSLGYELAVKGIPTIVFIPSNRHYPFTLARDINLDFNPTNLTEIDQILLMLAEKELGVESEVKRLLAHRVGVHTSYMLETEKEAVERAFKNQEVKLLFATGTLAQGLNLPSVAVVIAGTRIGDARIAHTTEARLRSKALILNAIGRAGRAGFSNQSLSLLVPNEPLIFKNEQEDIDTAILELDVLQDKDASITVKSPLEEFLDNIINGSIQADTASLYELTVVSMLTSDNELEEIERTKNIISKTYAASSIIHNIKEEKLVEATLAITKIKNDFLLKAKAPEWVISVSRKSGFDFFTTNVFIKIVNGLLSNIRKEEMIHWTIREWKDFLFLCLKDLPPHYIQRLLPVNITKKPTFINKMLRSLGALDEKELPWNKPSHWDDYWIEFSNITWLYMNGKTYADLAKYYLNIDGEVESTRTGGKPIPDALALVKRQIEAISSYAGLLVATLEELLFKDTPFPFNLNALPLAIKNGLKDHSTIFWFNYGLRNRIVAHTLGSALPIGDFSNEKTSRRNIYNLKKAWLNNEFDLTNLATEEREILEAASIILKNT